MKIQTSGTPFPAGKQFGGVTLNRVDAGRVTRIVRGSMSNYNTTSAWFAGCNYYVKLFDQLFEDLPAVAPPIGGSKLDWNIKSNGHPGWVCCSCDKTPVSGKKLFRSVNMGAVLTDSAVSNIVPAGSYWPTTSVFAIFGPNNYAPPFLRWQCTMSAAIAADSFVSVNLGFCMYNPFFFIPAGLSDGSIFPGTRHYELMQQLRNGQHVPTCQWLYNMLPCGVDSALVVN